MYLMAEVQTLLLGNGMSDVHYLPPRATSDISCWMPNARRDSSRTLLLQTCSSGLHVCKYTCRILASSDNLGLHGHVFDNTSTDNAIVGLANMPRMRASYYGIACPYPVLRLLLLLIRRLVDSLPLHSGFPSWRLGLVVSQRL